MSHGVARRVALAPADQVSELGKYKEWKRGEEPPSVGRQGKPTGRTFGGILIYIHKMNYIANIILHYIHITYYYMDYL